MTPRQFISQMTRKENWRQEEVSVLVEGISNRIDLMKRKFLPFLASDKKQSMGGSDSEVCHTSYF